MSRSHKLALTAVVGAALTVGALYDAMPATRAFESSSASFELHAGDAQSVTGSSSAASFQAQQAGGQNAIGRTLNTNRVSSGILYWLFRPFTPSYEQIHYRWRNDDGSEAAATWAAAEDTPLTSLAPGSAKRLRFEISNEGWTRGAAPSFRLEVAETASCSSGTYAAVPATATTEHWEMALSSHFADGDATTNVAGGLADANASFTAGEMKETGNQTSALTVTSADFTEIEYSIRATNNATAGGSYCFRLTNAGATTNLTYTAYAQTTLAGYAPSGSLESSTFDTTIADGAAYNSMLWEGSLNGGKVRLQIATSNNTGGPWNFAGPGPGCDATTYYEPAAGSPVEIDLACPAIQKKRYFRYKAILCSASNCSSSGSASPQVDTVVVNWSP